MAEQPLRSLVDHVEQRADVVEIDQTDVALLLELSRDARAPQRSMAKSLGMSSPAVADRLNRLRRAE